MKHFFRLLPPLPPKPTPHAKECFEKAMAMLAKSTEKKPEREPGQDDEEKAA